MTLTTRFLGSLGGDLAGDDGGRRRGRSSPPEPPSRSPIRYDADGKLQRPEYREWVFLGAGLDMTYGSRAASAMPDHHMFTNVFVNPASYRAFVGSGRWPDKTIFMLEVRHTGTDRRPNRAGLFQAEAVGLEAHVLDASKGGSRFYDFDGKTLEQPVAGDVVVQYLPRRARRRRQHVRAVLPGAADGCEGQGHAQGRFRRESRRGDPLIGLGLLPSHRPGDN